MNNLEYQEYYPPREVMDMVSSPLLLTPQTILGLLVMADLEKSMWHEFVTREKKALSSSGGLVCCSPNVLVLPFGICFHVVC